MPRQNCSCSAIPSREGSQNNRSAHGTNQFLNTSASTAVGPRACAGLKNRVVQKNQAWRCASPDLTLRPCLSVVGIGYRCVHRQAGEMRQMTSRWKRIATRSLRAGRQATEPYVIDAVKKSCQCSICGRRFTPWNLRAPTMCQPCGEIVMEIARVAGSKFVTAKAVLSVRTRQLLPQQILAASIVSAKKIIIHPEKKQ